MANQNNKLSLLRQHADQLRLSEIAVFLHNLGKCGEDFILAQARETLDREYYEQYSARVLRQLYPDSDKLPEKLATLTSNVDAKGTKEAFLVDGSEKAVHHYGS